MGRIITVLDDFTQQEVNREKTQIYHVDVTTYVKVGKTNVFLKGSLDLSHDSFMKLLGTQLPNKIAFQQWIRHSKAEQEELGTKGHFEPWQAV